jgi:tetratricopeptide (TPR) repeat protein
VPPVKAVGKVKAVPDKIYRSVSSATEPDAKQTQTDLEERNRYWDAHGRSDLVTQTTKPPMQDVKKAVEPVSREVKSAAAESPLKKSADNSQADSTENGIGFVSANPTRHELDERAKYWAARGRTDISAKVQIAEPKADSPVRPVVTHVARPAAPVRTVAAPVVATVAAPVAERVRSVTRTTAGESEQAGSEMAKPTSQELDDGAQYWEARGRSDLASQLRQKLQTLEPRHATLPRNAVQAPAIDVEKTKYNQSIAKTALEDALVKNPGSTQARLDLAQIYQGAGEFNKARGLIDGVLAGSPDQPAALYSSAQLYAEQRLWRETLFTLEKISPVSRNDEMGKLQKTAWAHVQIDRADAMVRQGNNREAELLLRQVAVELAVNYNQSEPPQTPSLWKSVTQKKSKH